MGHLIVTIPLQKHKFNSLIFQGTYANGIANNVDPDQMAPVQSDLGLHCLHRPVCPNIENFYVTSELGV